VRDNLGRNIAAWLAVADEQVFIEAEDHAAAYPLTIDPLFTPQQKLTAADGKAFEYFGEAVALDGDTLVVGAPYDTIGANQQQGAVYVFTRSGASQPVWTLQQKLSASDGATEDAFGAAVALSGDTLVAGAHGDAFGGDPFTNYNKGSAYVFTRIGATWSQQQKFFASDAVADDSFGLSVALSGDTMAAGMPGDDFDWHSDRGSVHVFVRPSCPPPRARAGCPA
jgi:hypothetical protein